ncbi:triple gene block protein [Ligustrum necrotic ringspot virus]|uniref:Movement protein TGBp3 n=1 Tax=Ligustrum necrotic ringspot virus TaxID=478550 RepID=B0LFC0_9VIRU|nr:triple gene block protein [Ligustrum necrotic ringspot virus]ABW69737.1 triple gene block protein [Ligustrum necrotic ringspot virus]
MRQSALNVCIALLSFLGMYLLMPRERNSCSIVISGEAITVSGCELTAEIIQAISQLRVQKLDL